MDEPWTDVQRAGAWLRCLERTLRPDVVHLNGYAHAHLRWSAPVVVAAHSCVCTWWRAVKNEPAPDRLTRYRNEVAAGLAAATRVVAPTAAMLAGLEQEYGLPSRAEVIPNGCGDHDEGAVRVADKEHLILSAGRAWDEAKNIAALTAVAPQLAWPVFVAGACQAPVGVGADIRPERHAVTFLGKLSAKDMAGWYRRAAIYALPARYEPFGLSVLEAARAGCALVLGDIVSLRENWEGAAVFVAPGDRPALATALQRLIEAPEVRADLARRAVDRAATLTLERTAERYLHLYESLAS
jgi:glycosyltransferase involved in cell wall biosynthesis